MPGGRRCRSLFGRGGACVPPLPQTVQPPATTNGAPPKRRRTNKGPLARRIHSGFLGVIIVITLPSIQTRRGCAAALNNVTLRIYIYYTCWYIRRGRWDKRFIIYELHFFHSLTPIFSSSVIRRSPYDLPRILLY